MLEYFKVTGNADGALDDVRASFTTDAWFLELSYSASTAGVTMHCVKIASPPWSFGLKKIYAGVWMRWDLITDSALCASGRPTGSWDEITTSAKLDMEADCAAVFKRYADAMCKCSITEFSDMLKRERMAGVRE